MKKTIVNIDDFFAQDAKNVAEKLIGMEIEVQKTGEVYTVSRTKPYHGDSKQTTNMPRLFPGGIMMFNIRGNPHFCVATGRLPEHDYVLINSVLDGETEIAPASRTSKTLGIGFDNDGTRFSDYFKLIGETKPSTFKQYDADASSCLGVYELKK
jgi:3-methyladenine DNA glycosylase Mpg